MAKVITVASGKGGVGKTSISLNLSLSLARAGQRVCLFDADLGLANVNILTGLYPDKGLAEVIAGRVSLSEILIRDYNGIDLIPGSSGVEKLADLTQTEAQRLVKGFLELSDYDYFILDTSAGISSQVLAFCRASHEIVLVVTPEPTSLTDAYSLLKVLSRQSPLPRIRVVINQVQTAAAAKAAYAKLKRTVERFLSLTLFPLGIVARDPNVPIAVVSQIPFAILFPETQASRCVKALALKLVRDYSKEGNLPVEAFWDQCLALLPQRADTPEPAKALPAATLPRAGETPGQEGELVQRLQNLEDKIATLLDEVSQIKSLLIQPVQTADQESGSPPKPPAKEVYALDFEDWLNRQKAGRSS